MLFDLPLPRGQSTWSGVFGWATSVRLLANQKTGRIVQGYCSGPNCHERCPNHCLWIL